ncbi:MAG: hypothetical protein LUC97_01870, partial [Clostridiales bacterium]|nr:hypothetical protein [Clostridiales bacterium]
SYFQAAANIYQSAALLFPAYLLIFLHRADPQDPRLPQKFAKSVQEPELCLSLQALCRLNAQNFCLRQKPPAAARFRSGIYA